ncbi:MAG: hypothetical protein NW241_15595 [Bacteroidia bacterium]|nr:hypothetical protein [Bacteroidia bacterium]
MRPKYRRINPLADLPGLQQQHAIQVIEYQLTKPLSGGGGLYAGLCRRQAATELCKALQPIAGGGMYPLRKYFNPVKKHRLKHRNRNGFCLLL